MSPLKKVSQASEEPAELKDALAALIANTKRVKRKLNLIEIAEKIATAKKYLSVGEIADRIILSKEMIREFERVNHLILPIKKMVEKGEIKSVEIADRLSRLPPVGQLYVAKKVARGLLNSDDLRAIVSFRKAMPHLDISGVVQRIEKSRNIKEFIAEFSIPKDLSAQPELIKKRFEIIFGADHIRATSIQHGSGHIILDAIAKDILVEKARKHRVTKREILQLIVAGEDT